MDPQELVPLESGLARVRRDRLVSRKSHVAPQSCHQVPLRLFRLLIMLIVVPTVFILVPLYLRYRVFSDQMYPMSMTDMRLIDSKISTTWCQRQVVKSNTTFNAFLVPGLPQLTEDLVPVSMTRELELEDDMKEYWGFYLLKGSSVTVSACVRYPGASLIMIKGYKHLQECAYIGDDSSEEIDELFKAFNLGLMSNITLLQKLQQLNKQDGKANQPGEMRRQKSGVSFHDPNNAPNMTSSSSESIPDIDITDHDPKELRAILERLHALRQNSKIQPIQEYHRPPNIMSLPALHRHRDANVDKNERRWLSFEDIDGNNSELMVSKNVQQQNSTEFINTDVVKENSTNAKTIKGSAVADQLLGKQLKMNNTIINTTKDTKKIVIESTTEVGDTTTVITQHYDDIKDTKHTVQEVSSKYTTMRPVTEPTSKEVFQDVLKRLQALGDRGKSVLKRLHQSMGVEYYEEISSKPKSDIMSAVSGSSEELDRLRKVLVEAIDEEKTKAQRQQKRRKAREEAREKKETMLGQIELQKIFNEDDEARDYAAEEGLDPDGYAEHHVQLNETTPFDMSNSEFWSSFSSSEEALLECEGLILNLPLTPHSSCIREASESESFSAAKANALTYRVPANGYYFFVFNSENEKQRNFIRARFDLQKTRYDVARTKLRECTNSTERCVLPLDIFSSQKVVLEVPLRDNDSLWNEQFVIISECEPRTSIYLICVIAVPILILVFAFQ